MEKLIHIKLKEILQERKMEQKELAEKTGLSTRTISELCNNKSKHIPKEALEKISIALNLESIEQLITFRNDDTN